MITGKLIHELNALLKPELQESYDNTGEQIVFRDTPVTGVLIAIDADISLIDEAKTAGANLIVTHHPLFFKVLKRIDPSDAKSAFVVSCIENKISLYAAHTNLDRLLRHKLCEELGFKPTDTLIKDVKSESDGLGFGSLAFIPEPITMKELLATVVKNLKVAFCLYTGSLDKQIKRIAFLNGSGGGSVEKIVNWHKPDCIITGDVNHHNARYAIERNVGVIDAGHYPTERVFLDCLADSVAKCLTDEQDIPIIISKQDQNPFKVFTA